MNTVWVFINITDQLLALAPCVLLCYLPFGGRLARPVRKIVVEASLACIAASSLCSLLYTAFGFDKSGNINTALFCIGGFFYYRKTVREGLQKLLFAFCVAIHAGSVAMGLETAAMVLAGVFDIERGNWWEIGFIPVRIAVFFLAGWVVYRLFTPRLKQIQSRNMKWMWLVPAVFSSIVIFYYTLFYETSMTGYIYPIVIVILSILSFFIYATLLRALDTTAKNARLESEITLRDRQLDMQRAQYTRLMENAEVVKSMRHDLRHQLSVIKRYSNSGDREKLNEYLGELAANIPVFDDKMYCDNFAVNAVVTHYLGLAESEGVTVDARFDVPEDTGCVAAMDLCVITGNFLENALEACRRMQGGNKFISIRSSVETNTLSIGVINSFDGLWNEKNGVYLSRKKNGEVREGVGLSSVKAVCTKYDGLVQIEISGKVWKASALVYMVNEHPEEME